MSLSLFWVTQQCDTYTFRKLKFIHLHGAFIYVIFIIQLSTQTDSLASNNFVIFSFNAGFFQASYNFVEYTTMLRIYHDLFSRAALSPQLPDVVLVDALCDVTCIIALFSNIAHSHVKWKG